MKIAKRILILVLVYVGIVAGFESLLGYFQPANQATLVIATTDEDGKRSDRVVSRLESNGDLYVAANHWPRAWFRRALENPAVFVTLDDGKDDEGKGAEPKPYQVVPITGEEHERVDRENSLPIAFRVLTGFPPRMIVRLDPR